MGSGFLISCILLTSLACGIEPQSAWAESSQGNVVSHFKSRWKPFSANTKILLVAGSSDNGNFTQEILDQRRLWLSQGFREDEIACYYVAPNSAEYRRDHDQYLELALWLPDCFPASAKLLREHLAILAKEAPDFLYLYITTHGRRPAGLELSANLGSEKRFKKLQERAQYPVLDQYRLIIEALPTGPASERELLEAYLAGKNPRDLYLTPPYLREMMAAFPADTPKILVLQACYSGGFIEDPQNPHPHQSLTTVPNMTILTAARYDRSSFGCHAGPKTTYFGGIFNEELKAALDHPTKINWQNLFLRVEQNVLRMEEELIEDLPSLPAFFSNVSPGPNP